MYTIQIMVQNSIEEKTTGNKYKSYLIKKEFGLDRFEYEQIFNQAPHAAYKFVCKLYEFLTKKKLNLDKLEKLPKINLKPEVPSYARPTNSLLAKDKELIRIIDDDEKKMKTLQIIEQHNMQLRKEKQDNNIIEYLVIKRKKQLEEQLKLEEEKMIERKKKYNVDQSFNQEIKEIQLKSYKSSTSKKNKENQGQISEAKGILDFLQDNCSQLLKKDLIDKEIRKFGLEKKPQIIFEIFSRCDEINDQVLNTFLIYFQESSLKLIIEMLNNNFLDFKKFFGIFFKSLNYFDKSHKTFENILNLFKKVGANLVQIDPQITQSLFENIILKDLITLALKYTNKREPIVEIFYYFCGPDSLSRLHLIQKIKEILTVDLNNFISILSILIQYNYEDFDEELYNQLLHYSTIQLDSPSPRSRTNALKILNEITIINPYPILGLLGKFQKLIKDNWWEVSCQIIIICSNLLHYLAKKDEQYMQMQQQYNERSDKKQIEDQSKKSSEVKKVEGQQPTTTETKQQKQLNQEEDEVYMELKQEVQLRQEQKSQLLNIINELFKQNVSSNILQVGLIYTAPILNEYPELCGRHLDILLDIEDKIRKIVLTTNPDPEKEEGQIVRGCTSFRYKLTSAPVEWNSVGIAQSLDLHVQTTKLQDFCYKHLEIMYGCLYQQLDSKDSKTWFGIYENLKKYIFIAFTRKDLCEIASQILKKFFLFEAIQEDVLKNSDQIFFKLLGMVYHVDVDEACKQNLLEFFEFLIGKNEIFQTYIYNIIKEFSEKNKNLFLKSNLIDFMNNLAKERRKKLHENIEHIFQ
eukprot:TRINITY_DN949_c0_g1_i1.p1 TRINITY_DN949_c0_g1~~TRINITY_DN949_c0_g1_i1.p1  ORF type:complete len:805 (-),score=152.08 TRINITY_DN949_c0_g1_i1:109-2523(-)